MMVFTIGSNRIRDMKIPNRKEFGSAFKNGWGRTISFLLSKGLTVEEARESAQAAWVKGWERRDQICSKLRIVEWVNSIALNVFRSNYRKKIKEKEFEESALPPEVNIALMDLRRSLMRCRERDRTILTKYYLQGFDSRELAGEYGCSETAVRVRIMRARRNVRNNLTDYSTN
jgi:RNA polymerase sigma-70 factor (ECF subfamily)